MLPAAYHPDMIEVDAKPAALELEPARTAVLVIDMQNDFGSPGGMFDAAGIDISGIQQVVGSIRKVLDAARAAAIPVVHVRMAHSPDLSDAGAVDGPHRIKHARMRVGVSDALVEGTWNTEILPELRPIEGEPVITKTRYSGFYETDLDAKLHELGAKYLVVTGCTTSICVESTVRDAMFRDYSCLVLEDCTAEPIGQENHESTLRAIQLLFGWTATSDSLLRALALEPAQQRS
jgi:ureidoacrylate peracid hydrolase